MDKIIGIIILGILFGVFQPYIIDYGVNYLFIFVIGIVFGILYYSGWIKKWGIVLYFPLGIVLATLFLTNQIGLNSLNTWTVVLASDIYFQLMTYILGVFTGEKSKILHKLIKSTPTNH